MNGSGILTLEVATISEEAVLLLLLLPLTEEVVEVIVLLMVTRIPAKALDAAGEVARTNLAVRPEKCLQGGASPYTQELSSRPHHESGAGV